jgi:signal transduction histidine kinase
LRALNWVIGRRLQPIKDGRRRPEILQAILSGLIALAALAAFVSLTHLLGRGPAYHGIGISIIFGSLAVLIGLYALQFRYLRVVSVLFIAILFCLSTIPLVIWGASVPQGLLMYALVIIVSGITIGSNGAIVTTVIVNFSLLSLTYAQINHLIEVNLSWLDQDVITYADSVTFVITMSIIMFVVWLSNREVESSLTRAYRSERALRNERNQLEAKVRQRTEELEKAQFEQALELQRFAEFGRLASGLVHDISNPLTAMAINLAELDSQKESEVIKQTGTLMRYIERYVLAVRKQMQNRSSEREFEVKQEVQQVIEVLTYRAQQSGIRMSISGTTTKIFGDPVKFSQIVANLIANGIDSYDGIDSKNQKTVKVSIIKVKEKAIIEVIDHGVGITNTQISKIFEPFYSTGKRGRGIGIGLAMTKRYVEIDFGGNITVTSRVERGTRFKVTIPLQNRE